MKKIKILDCTLRDGGYYNNWDFSNEVVKDYLEVMATVRVDYVELGFRSFQTKDFKGPTWYTTESYLNSLQIPKSIKIGVMVNVFELISHPLGITKATKLMFKNAKESKISFVRLASHFEEFPQAAKVCKILQNMGYFVAINLMQISEQSEQKIVSVTKLAKKINPDILYFADSLGGMDPSQISNLIKIFRKNWSGSLGIHTHNNLGKALANSLAAINLGVTWIDSTVTGMGRGPGNAQTEYLLIEMQNLEKRKVNILPLLKLIQKHFDPMKSKYKWGMNPYYYLAGKYGIHPTYIQEMLTIQLNESEVIGAINQLKDSGGNKYNVDLVRSEFQKPMLLKRGKWSPAKAIKNKEVLLIASGPKANDYKFEIEKYIKSKKPYVIALNTNVGINNKLINIFAACNPLKLIADVDLYKSLNSPLAVPKSLLSEDLKRKFKNIKLLDFGVGIKENHFEFHTTGAVMPRLYTLVYALSIATSGNASKVLLAGFDGYGIQNRRTKIIDELLYLYSSSKGAKPIVAVTPTSYSVASASIYTL
jgi:4-hydroxy 2-oxovalerate aldolase